jgi:type IV secretory pathway VirB10-like protein
MATRLENLSGLFSNVRTRSIIIAAGGIVVLIIIVGIIGLRRNAADTAAGAKLTKATNLQSVPGINPTSPQYAQIQQQVNQQNFDQAVKTQSTAIPTVITAQSLQNVNNPEAFNTSANATNNGTTDGTDSTDGTATGNGNGNTAGGNASGGANGQAGGISQAQLQAMQAQQKEQMQQMQNRLNQLTSQQAQQQMQQTAEAMQRQAQQLMASWNSNTATPTQQYVTGAAANAAGNANAVAGSQVGNGINSGINSSTTTGPTPSMIKAGTVLFAVLDTAVNSDQPGPVMATVVEGQFKGAKLLGSIQQSQQLPGTNGPETLVLSFNTMSVPYQPQSVTVSAYAINPDTARTAIASDVDHHYMLRYGSLFASAFLQGYGQAVSQAGSTTTTNLFGTTTTNYGNLSGIEEVTAGLGQVGQSWGAQLGQTFNRQNTVYINSGLGIGILFTSDVTQPNGTTPPPATVNSNSSIPPASATMPVGTTTNNNASTSSNGQLTGTSAQGVPGWVPAPGQ